MKKILSAILILCMIASMCLPFTSCSKKLTEKAAEKDSLGTIGDAFTLASDNFFADTFGISSIVDKASNGGSYTLSVESEDLLGPVKEISEKIYINSDKQKLVSDTLVNIDGEEYSARIFSDKESFMFSSADILGSDTTLAVNFDTFVENFRDSALAELAGMNSAGAEVDEMLDSIFESLENAYDTEKTEEIKKEFVEKLDEKVETDKIKVDGKEVKCITITYTIDNDAIEFLIEEYGAAYSTASGMVSASDILDIDELLDVEIDIEFFINQKTKALIKAELSGSFLDKELNESVEVEAELSFSAEEMLFSVEASGEAIGETIKADVEITKEDSKKETVFTVEVNAGTKEATAKVLKAEFTYEKKSGDFELAIDIYNDGEDRLKSSIEGNVKSTKKDATIKIEKMSFDDYNVELDISLVIKASDKMPETPSNAKDITEMTAEEWEEIITDISESKLVSLIGNLGFGAQEGPEPGYDNYEEYYWE